MQVYVNDPKDPAKRVLIEAKLIKENHSTIVVELPDGNIIKRRKKRDLPE